MHEMFANFSPEPAKRAKRDRKKKEVLKAEEQSGDKTGLNPDKPDSSKRTRRIAAKDKAKSGEKDKNPVQKILNRKKIRAQDCRKTPAGGIITPKTGPDAPRTPPKKVQIRAKWCRNCDSRHNFQSCPLRRPENVFTDAVMDFSSGSSSKSGGNNIINNKNDDDDENLGLDLSKSFAQLSLPSPPLTLEERESGHGLSVVAKTAVAAKSRFGPLQGERIQEKVQCLQTITVLAGFNEFGFNESPRFNESVFSLKIFFNS